MGYIGDKYGRKQMLLLASIIMISCTFLIGLLPDFHTIGLLAPVLLITSRILEGVGISVEFTGVTTYQVERSSDKKNILGSLVKCTTFIGVFYLLLLFL